MRIQINMSILDSKAVVPEYQHSGDAGLDLVSLDDKVLAPGERFRFRTGLAIQIPNGYVGLCCSRSGLALEHGIIVLNAPGIVDSSYRGDCSVILTNLSNAVYTIKKGDRIAQLVIVPVGEVVKISEVAELPPSDRGTDGFGSSG